jgi:hypothetical protein
MRRMMLAVFLFCFIPTFAKTPMPEALLNAKTAFVNNIGTEDKDFTKFCDALKKWGRFELVQDRMSADIVIKLYAEVKTRTIELPGIGGGVQSEKVLVNCIRIVNARDDIQLWFDETSGDSKDPKQLVDKLKNKMKQK